MRSSEGRSDHGSASSDEHRAARRRQRVLEVVRDSAMPLSLEELARAVVDGEPTRGAAPEGGGEDADRVRIRLHHVDLPKLRNRGAIEYDPSRRLVSSSARTAGAV